MKSKKMVRLVLTLEQFETIKTAVNLEYEKNYNTGADAERLLRDAKNALEQWKAKDVEEVDK